MLGPMGSFTLLEKFLVELWGFLRPNQSVIFGQDTGFTFRKEKNIYLVAVSHCPFPQRNDKSENPGAYGILR